MSEALETAERFTGLAAGYDRYRPGYPAQAIAAVLEGLQPGADVVDVGAGTGISSRALRDAGAHVVAIEPNAEMRAVASASGIDARPGRADATGLADACADVVAAFQAFHWFTDAASLAEFGRLLRPGGRIALVWNDRDTRNDACTRETRELEKRYAVRTKLAGADFFDSGCLELLRANGFPHVRTLTFANDQRLDRDGLRGRIFSTSYAPRTGPSVAALAAALDDLHERYADNSGHVTISYRTDVVIGER